MAAKKKSAKAAPAKRVKAGTSKAAAAARKIELAHAFITNGGNWTQAAVAAGHKPGRAAEKAGERASKDVVVQKIIAEARKKAAEKATLTVELTLREVARIAYFDPKNLYREDGTLKPVYELDEDTRAAVASMEFEEANAEGKTAATVKKVKLCSKDSALEKAMRHLGLYEADNRQRPAPIELPPGVRSVRLDFSKVRSRAKQAANRH